MKSLLLSLFILLAVAPLCAAQSQPVKLEGQVVCCEDCWARADRRTVPFGTRADLEKAKECVAGGDPTLLAVLNEGGEATLYELEDGKYKRPGKDWLGFVGKRVEVAGRVRAKGDKRFVKVDALKVVADAPAATEQLPNVVGNEAELVLKDLFGVEQRLSALRGRVVVLNFWATYCAPCRKEMPDLAAIQNQYAALGVQVVGASAEGPEDQQKVLQFVRETKVNFPVWLGATVADMARFGLGPDLPGTAIVGRDGKIVWVTRGVVGVADLKRQLDTLLAEAEREANRQRAAAAKVRARDASSVPS
jgi:thiol-disulfide isomerase/thioredoxin